MKEREAFIDRIFGWFIGIVSTVGVVLLGWEFLKIYIFRPLSRNDNFAMSYKNKGFFTDMNTFLRSWGKLIVFGWIALELSPYVMSFIIGLFFSFVRTLISKVKGSFMRGISSVKNMFDREVGENENKDDENKKEE